MVGFSFVNKLELANSECFNETTTTTLWRKLDSNGALACKEEPLHSWEPGSNRELDKQQQQQLSFGSNSSLLLRERTQNVIEM
jgi:hypothetical protein